MTDRGARLLRRALLSALAATGGLVLLALAAAYLLLRASLPPLDGRLTQRGLASRVTLERDALGVVTVTAATRTALAFGTGFAHGQDRFFQMDLERRLAAGELSALVGPAALARDRVIRRFRFRALAREVLAQASPRQRSLLEAYARGVNAGLESLRSRPWEYWVLRTRPSPWKPEDSILVVYSMWWDLQHSNLRADMLRRQIDARLGGPLCGAWKCALAFLYPARTAWDAPNVADEAALRAEDARDAIAPSIPGPEALDVRNPSSMLTHAGRNAADTVLGSGSAESADVGSNAWAVSGRYTATGAALVASDMHLALQVPPTWYRMRLRLAGPGVPAAKRMDLNGLTLPGAPVLVAGSNGHIAWAFTNADGDWVDARPVTCLAVSRSSMKAPGGIVPLSTVIERIAVRGRPDVRLPVTTGPHGVLFQVDASAHRCWFASWLAEVPAATNVDLLALERATSVEQALALAPGIGIPHQNLIVGDSAGHIGWTIAGRIPLSFEAERGSEHASERAGRRAGGRAGWRTAAAAPRSYDPPLGLLWTANARATNDPAALAAIGGAEASVGAQYVLGARARQIRNGLLALPSPVRPAQMLAIQLDDRAIFLARWRRFILALLDRAALAGRPERAQLRALVASWDAHADVGSVGYRLVRAFHDQTQDAVWRMILDSLALDADDPPPPQFEQALWALVTRQPLYLLTSRYPSWRAFLLDEVDRTIGALQKRCGSLARCRWGAAHPVHIRHPLSQVLPFLSPLIDMPRLELPGDRDMPRVQEGAFGASERFAVSPGHEAAGYLELPGGQSGHPLSPYYRAGFRAWAQGKPLPFLPGPAQHRLMLEPSAARGAGGAVHSAP